MRRALEKGIDPNVEERLAGNAQLYGLQIIFESNQLVVRVSMHNLLGPNPKPVSPKAENALSPGFSPEKFVCEGASGTSGVAGSMDWVAVNELSFSH